MHEQGARVMLFVGGPPTVGPGMVVGRPKTEDIRECLCFIYICVCRGVRVCASPFRLFLRHSTYESPPPRSPPNPIINPLNHNHTHPATRLAYGPAEGHGPAFQGGRQALHRARRARRRQLARDRRLRLLA